MSGRHIAGLVLIEPALPDPYTLVTSRTAGRNRERGHFFPNPDEARTFATELAAQRGMMLVDFTAAAEGEAA
jgi:hypothetical protein